MTEAERYENMMNVHIVAERYEHKSQWNIRFIMVANKVNASGDTISMISPVKYLPHDTVQGNPYGVYGDVVREFTGVEWDETNITVSEVTSGDLSKWEE